MTAHEQNRDLILANSHVDPESGCWYFRSQQKGYVAILSDERVVGGHRIAYTSFVGNIPSGWLVHHKCKNPPCVNPLHLEVMTPQRHQFMHAVRSNP